MLRVAPASLSPKASLSLPAALCCAAGLCWLADFRLVAVWPATGAWPAAVAGFPGWLGCCPLTGWIRLAVTPDWIAASDRLAAESAPGRTAATVDWVAPAATR